MNKTQNIEMCRRLISIASTDKAIQVLSELTAKNYRDETIILSNRWEELNNQFILNVIEQSKFEIERNKINTAILLLLTKIENLEKLREPVEVVDNDGIEKFIQEIERIYKLLGARFIEKNIIINDHLVPLIATFPKGPFNFKVIVDVCISKEELINKEKINKLILKFQSAREVGRADKGIFVSKSSFSPEAKKLAQKHNLTCIKIDELYNQLINFNDYLEENLEQFKNNSLSKLYVQQKGSDVEDYFALTSSEEKDFIHYPLIKYVDELFFKEDEKQIAILGNFGTGKTSFCQKIKNELLKKYQKDLRNRIPVLISLRDFRAGIDIEQLIINHLQKQKGIEINTKIFGELQRMGRFVFILDGLDEMATKVDRIVINENLREISRLNETGDNIYLITCRTHFFQDKIADEFLKDYRVIYLTDWGRKELEEYIKNRFPKKWKLYYEEITSKLTLEELAKTPMLLEMIVKSLSKFSEGQELNSRYLYQTYTNEWIESQSKRRGAVMSKSQRKNFVEKIAQRIYLDENSNIHFSDLYEIAKDISGYVDATRIDYFDTDARTSTFITKDSSGNYGFYHRSFMEYFCGDIITNEIQTGTPFLLSKKFIQNEVFDFLDFDLIKDQGVANLKRWSEIFKEKYLSRNSARILLHIDEEIDKKVEEHFGFEKSEWVTLEKAVLLDDEAIFSKFVQENYVSLIAYARSLTGRYGDKVDLDYDDIIQELFLRLWSRMKEGKADNRQFLNTKSYLYVMLRNMVIDRQRRASKRINLEMKAFDESNFVNLIYEESPLKKMEANDIWRKIEAFLDEIKVNEVTKKAFVMRYQDGFNYKEIAEELNENPSSLRARVNRTRLKIVDRFKNEFKE